MKWFGEPWPGANYRAPVCEDDKDRVPIPIGHTCSCGRLFTRYDRGVMIPFYDAVTGWRHVAYHVKCFLSTVVGERMATEITARWSA